MDTAFLWDDKVAGASIVALAGTTVAGMPLSNLADPQPRLRARLRHLSIRDGICCRRSRTILHCRKHLEGVMHL
jgi:hypothetical protein